MYHITWFYFNQPMHKNITAVSLHNVRSYVFRHPYVYETSLVLGYPELIHARPAHFNINMSLYVYMQPQNTLLAQEVISPNRFYCIII